MASEFVRLTSRETGGEVYVRKGMIAGVGSGYKGATHVTLINEDIDFEVMESPLEVIRLIEGEKEHGSRKETSLCTNTSTIKS